MCGVGINDADYIVQRKTEHGYEVCPYYDRWNKMLKRCYGRWCRDNRPTYEECTVIEGWKIFSVFRRWMETQDWEGKGLDKDIIRKGNKIYSPEHCCFITDELNNLVLTKEKALNGLPVGVAYNKATQRFKAVCSHKGKPVRLGTHGTIDEAREAYSIFKSELIRVEADKQTDPRIRAGLLHHANNLT